MYSFPDAAHTVMWYMFSLNCLHSVQLLPVLILRLLVWEADVTFQGAFSCLSWSWSTQLSNLSPVMTHALLLPALNVLTMHCRILWPALTAGLQSECSPATVELTAARRLRNSLQPGSSETHCSPAPVELTAARLRRNSLGHDTTARKFCSPQLCSDIRQNFAVSAFPAFSCCSV
jgi:hypothetical protein